ncbi:4'-phosphopantetheinyl transferase superfamily protein [Streptomyces sp. NBC_01390]|uniref:4'-phosphopantetheinyl transferase family protein n=1 Tax=Streptomyces sp. NBC_01390 TaxID=2903850 RepID=UPI00324F27A7
MTASVLTTATTFTTITPVAAPGPWQVHLWTVPLDGPAAHTAAALAPLVLDPGERRRAARLLLPEDRRRWTTARVALRRVLGAYTGLPPARITFAYGRHGRPRLDGTGDRHLHFNLTHSRDRALLAVCRDTPVGADLEHLDAGPPDDRGLDELAEAVLAPPELGAYRELPYPDRRAALLRRWTGKEALLKATGRGVTLAGVRRVTVPDGAGPAYGVPGEWTLLRPEQAGPYTAAIAVPRDVRTGNDKDWEVVENVHAEINDAVDHG